MRTPKRGLGLEMILLLLGVCESKSYNSEETMVGSDRVPEQELLLKRLIPGYRPKTDWLFGPPVILSVPVLISYYSNDFKTDLPSIIVAEAQIKKKHTVFMLIFSLQEQILIGYRLTLRFTIFRLH